jgi:hypothetical protein
MAEFDFIMTDDEQCRIFDFVIKHGAKLIPSLWYTEPKYDIINDPDKLLQLRRQMSGPIFIVWDDIFKYPLEFTRVTKKDGVFYFLNQKHGGPYLDYLPSRRLERDSGIQLISGFVAYYTKYIVSPLGSTVDIPQSLKKKYREICGQIQSLSTKCVTEKIRRYYWVGKKASELIRNGQVNNTLSLVL